MDVHVEQAISTQLRRRGLIVVTAQTDGTARLPDREILARATALDLVVFTRDPDFIEIATYNVTIGVNFSGVVYAQMHKVSIGQCVKDLDLIGRGYDPLDMANSVEYLPLR